MLAPPNRMVDRNKAAVPVAGMSKQLAELYSDIVTLSKHPELGAEILHHIKSVVGAKHNLDKFQRDLEIVALEFTERAAVRSVPKSMLPPFRQVLMMASPQKILEPVAVSFAIQTQLTARKTDIWYDGGSVVHVKTSSMVKDLTFVVLRRPILKDSEFHSWVVEEHWQLVVDEVCAIIAGICGQAERQQTLERNLMLVLRPNFLKEELVSLDSAAEQLRGLL